ncbi:MAG TPA: hypothetical protein VK178_07025 [Opitutaceae bacterium]|nr:hypothetical protein [Opitutaceae bacterium]
MKRALFPLIVAVLIGGCATPYQNDGLIGGASETQLSATQYRVRFRGNAHTTPERAADFCLLRCAEIALREGFPCFAIVDERTRVDHTEWQQPGAYQADLRRTGPNTYQGNVTGGPTTWNYARPTTDNSIVLLGADAKGPSVYEAAFITKSVKARYGIKTPDPVAEKFRGYTADEMEAAAAEFETAGKIELAADARKTAAELRAARK